MIAQLAFIKVFYMFAKWFQGFFINYMIFSGVLGSSRDNDHEILLQTLYLLGGWGTTISMFLHTLKFKKYIGPRTSMLLYTGSFPFFIGGYFYLACLTIEYRFILALAATGALFNYTPQGWVQGCWQICTACILLYTRYNKT